MQLHINKIVVIIIWHDLDIRHLDILFILCTIIDLIHLNFIAVNSTDTRWSIVQNY